MCGVFNGTLNRKRSIVTSLSTRHSVFIVIDHPFPAGECCGGKLFDDEIAIPEWVDDDGVGGFFSLKFVHDEPFRSFRRPLSLLQVCDWFEIGHVLLIEAENHTIPEGVIAADGDQRPLCLVVDHLDSLLIVSASQPNQTAHVDGIAHEHSQKNHDK